MKKGFTTEAQRTQRRVQTTKDTKSTKGNQSMHADEYRLNHEAWKRLHAPTLPRSNAPTGFRIIAFTLVLAAVSFARPLYILAADANDCVVWRVDPNLVPYLAEIGDVNEAWGHLLPPSPGDVNDWQVACGKFQRLAARACDPEGDAFTIRFVGGTSPATVYHDADAGTWWFTAEILRGVNIWRFSAMDVPLYAEPATSFWWVTCWGLAPQNTAPVLE